MLTALVVVVVLTVLTALYVAAEFSAISVRRSRVRQMAEDGHFLALRLAPFVSDARRLDTYIAASQIGITLTSLILGAYGQAAISPTIAEWIMPWASGDAAWARSAASIATLVVLTTFNVIVGELVPKTLALQYPTPVALATVMPMLWSLTLYRPFIGILNGSGNLVLRLFGVHQSGHRHVHSPEELELLIAESRDGGLLEPDEHRRLQRGLRLRLRSARELMVPWSEVEVIDVAEPLWQVIDRLSQSEFTRVPVFKGERTPGDRDPQHQAPGAAPAAGRRPRRPRRSRPAGGDHQPDDHRRSAAGAVPAAPHASRHRQRRRRPRPRHRHARGRAAGVPRRDARRRRRTAVPVPGASGG